MEKYLSDYTIKIFKDENLTDEGGEILYGTFERVHSNNLEEYVWNLSLSGYLFPNVVLRI